MPYPIAHGLIGVSIVAAASSSECSVARNRWLLLLGFVLGICPDFDFFLIWFFQFDKTWHRGFSHSLLFAFFVALLITAFKGKHGVRTFMMCSLAISSHAVLDAAVSNKHGVPFFWPWVHRFAFGLLDYPDAFHLKYYPSSDLLALTGVRRLIVISMLELAVCAPILLCVLVARRVMRRT